MQHRRLARVTPFHLLMLALVAASGFLLADPAIAVTTFFATPTGPLAGAITALKELEPGFKALAVFGGFIVAVLGCIALKNFGNVVMYVGIAVFAAVGLTVGMAISGATIDLAVATAITL